MAALKRVSIGFRGGQVLAVRVDEETLAALHGALGGGGWHEVRHEEGVARVSLDQVVYVQVDSAEPRVGFGA
ncbi:MAG TPA: hypothetical protein VHI73_08390 [Solirubrobacteraceae bacterium]|jgi:hypothetical protein|nr:hypothetical protein [Solirubrobacteraceae bacterium]